MSPNSSKSLCLVITLIISSSYSAIRLILLESIEKHVIRTKQVEQPPNTVFTLSPYCLKLIFIG